MKIYAKSISQKLVSTKYTIYWGIHSPKFINFVYRFCATSSNNFSGDQDDVTTMVEEEISENETNTMILVAILQLVI